MRFVKRTPLAASPEEVYRWHLRPGAFERLAPPWQSVDVKCREGAVDQEGARVTLSMGFGPFRQEWVAEHREIVPGRGFTDVQLAGPFANWRHQHRFLPGDDGRGTLLEDAIDFAPPLGAVGAMVSGRAIIRSLERVFRYRHTTTARDLAAHRKYSEISNMKILVTGSSGLVGSVLLPFLRTGGHDVQPLVRGEVNGHGKAVWNPATGAVAAEALEGFDVVVHLAGESIADGRWSEARKTAIRDSRVQGTTLLSETLAGLPTKPKAFVSASAIGFYGDRGDELLDEQSRPGDGFLADVCKQWESATAAASEAGIRVVNLRIGIVLSPKGGALAKMLTPFRMGAGGMIGSGNQFMSFITVDELASVILHAIATDGLRGPVNAVAPEPVTNRELTATLGRVLGRPTLFPLPAFAARLALGEMADELLLSSARVVPKKLLASGYQFQSPELEGSLRHILGKS